jgi:hypothetical protein
MQLSYQTRWLPKAGNTSREYEDAFAPRRSRPARPVRSKRFAVADGASESLLAGRWADLLVRTFCAAGSRTEPASVFGDAIRQWPEVLSRYADEREGSGKPIQWFEEPGLDRGAFATLVGLQLDEDSDRRSWSAVALGDSCVLHFRGTELLNAFPRRPGDRFDSNPPLICSRATNLGVVAAHTERCGGTFEVGDNFVLVTDAVAAWSLDLMASGEGSLPTQLFFETETRRAFNRAIRDLRSEGKMRNDDVTVMHISVEE